MSRGPKLEELDSTLNHELVRLRDEIRTVKGKTVNCLSTCVGDDRFTANW